MGMLSAMLSSAVIAAIISYASNNKNNELKYITSERATWRKEIKKITLRLNECSCYGNKAKEALAELKLRINTYGKRKEGQFANDICLDYFADEHIWKEISAIEVGEDFDKHKQTLCTYLSLLLKFDWERSKQETKPMIKNWITLILYIAIVFLQGVSEYGVFLRSENASKTVLDFLNGYILVIIWELYALSLIYAVPLMKKLGIIKIKDIYNKQGAKLFLYFLAMVFIITVYFKIPIYSEIVLACTVGKIILGLIVLVGEIASESFYRDYVNAIRKKFLDENLLIYCPYTMICMVEFLRLETNLANNGITYTSAQNPNQCIVDEVYYTTALLRLSCRIPYWFSHLITKATVKDYLEKNPNACKIICRYGDTTEIGWSRKVQKRLIEEIK